MSPKLVPRQVLAEGKSRFATAGQDVLPLVVTANAQRARPRTEELQHLRGIRPAVRDVANGDDLILVPNAGGPEEILERIPAAVDVSDDQRLVWHCPGPSIR